MSYERVCMLWEALRGYPNGTTSKVIAAKLNWPLTRASLALGQLAMYGVIDRVPHPTERGFRYSIKRVQ